MVEPWSPDWGSRTFIMGVINVTPDSFSGDGLAGDPDAILRRGRRLVAEGADVLDVGGESTRPQHVPVPLEEELRRAVPAVRLLAGQCAAPISIDTTKPAVARAAVEAGASIVNDISGGRDPAMLAVVAEHGCSLVLVHNDETPAAERAPNVVKIGLRRRVERALEAGIPPVALLIDPGLGFGKTWRQNLEVLHHLSELRACRLPVLVGPSRKATISRVLGVGLHDRLEGTAALVAVSIAHGADVVRVHDCLQMSRVARMVDAVARPYSRIGTQA